MTIAVALRRLSDAGSGVVAGVERAIGPVRRLLTLSLGQGVLMPIRAAAVSIEKGGVSVAAGSRFLSRVGLRKAMGYSLDEGRQAGPDRLASTVSLALRELGAPRKGIVLAIPRDWAILREVTLPGAVKENLTEVIGYELDRLTPFSSEDAYYDFRVLGEEDGKVSLLVVAAKAGLVAPYLEALKGEGISVGRLTVNASGLASLCTYACRRPESVCVEVDSRGFQGVVARASGLASSFRGANPSRDREEMIDAMAGALRPVVEGARKEGFPLPVFIASKNGEYAEALRRRLNLPVGRLSEEARISKFSGKAGGLSWPAAGALLESLWPGAQGLNLLKKGHHERERVPWAVTALLIILLVAVWVPYGLLPLQREGKRLAEIERQISLRKAEVKKVDYLRSRIKELTGEIAAIDQFKEGKPMALTILKELTATLPATAWATRIRITDGSVDIEGYAKSASGLLPVLERSKYLKKAEFVSPTTRDVRLDADRFSIKTEIEGSGMKEGEGRKDEGKK